VIQKRRKKGKKLKRKKETKQDPQALKDQNLQNNTKKKESEKYLE